jgi:hypothetical protein
MMSLMHPEIKSMVREAYVRLSEFEQVEVVTITLYSIRLNGNGLKDHIEKHMEDKLINVAVNGINPHQWRAVVYSAY